MDSYKLNLIYSNLDEAGKKLQKALKELYGISKRNAPDILRKETPIHSLRRGRALRGKPKL